MSQHESSLSEEDAREAVRCSYNPPEPPSGSLPVDANYPTYRFQSPSLGSGTVSVKLRRIVNGQWEDRTHINLDASLEPLLNSFVDNMSWFSRTFGDNGYGNISWIGDAGGRPGTRRSTYHNVGRALDVTWVQWIGGYSCRLQVAESEVFDSGGQWRPTTHRRLVAVEAGLRKWFGYVLNRYVGCLTVTEACRSAEGPQSSHSNHFHADNGCPVALRVVRSSGVTRRFCDR